MSRCQPAEAVDIKIRRHKALQILPSFSVEQLQGVVDYLTMAMAIAVGQTINLDADQADNGSVVALDIAVQ